jgi:hypothetical protein
MYHQADTIGRKRRYYTSVEAILTSSSVAVLGTEFQLKYINDEMSKTLLVCRD